MVIVVLCVMAMPAWCGESPQISLQIGAQVIRCEAGPVGDASMLKRMLLQGASVTVKWVFSIQRVHRYWLNDSAGEVVVTRVVSTDLISRHWQMRDETAGTVTETNDPNRAVRFLSYLDSFPLIDRSLLEVGAPYEVTLKLHVRDSGQPQAWWQRWVDFGLMVLTHRFTLPAER
ncbi:MAG: DUF4390 domain-containing protein [Mariprofundales bacterium]